jgi:hypothetical protein
MTTVLIPAGTSVARLALSTAAATRSQETVLTSASVGPWQLLVGRAGSNTEPRVEVDEWDPDFVMTDRPLSDREIETLLTAATAEFDESDYSHLFYDED